MPATSMKVVDAFDEHADLPEIGAEGWKDATRRQTGSAT